MIRKRKGRLVECENHTTSSDRESDSKQPCENNKEWLSGYSKTYYKLIKKRERPMLAATTVKLRFYELIGTRGVHKIKMFG